MRQRTVMWDGEVMITEDPDEVNKRTREMWTLVHITSRDVLDGDDAMSIPVYVLGRARGLGEPKKKVDAFKPEKTIEACRPIPLHPDPAS